MSGRNITIDSPDSQLYSAGPDGVLRGLLAEVDNATLENVGAIADLFIRVFRAGDPTRGALIGAAVIDSFCGKVAELVRGKTPFPEGEEDPRKLLFPMLKLYSAWLHEHDLIESY